MSACTVAPFPANAWKGGGAGQRFFQGWEIGIFHVVGPTSYDTDGSLADFSPWYGSILVAIPGLWMPSGGLEGGGSRRLPIAMNAEALGTHLASATRFAFLETGPVAPGEYRQCPAGTNLVNLEFLCAVIGTPLGNVLTAAGGFVHGPED